jgi:hypothetical protein
MRRRKLPNIFPSKVNGEPPAELNTFSIAARCPRTGALGVAVTTAVPAVGAICPYVVPGLGAVSTQAWVNPQGHSVLFCMTAAMASLRCSAKCSKPSTIFSPIRRSTVRAVLRHAART